jgi:Tfp pilus assembly pilus retraction ATPase PilT
MCKSCRRLCRAYLHPLRAPRLYLLHTQHAHSTHVVHVVHVAHIAHTAHTAHTQHTQHMCTRIAAVRPCGRKTQLELRVGQYLTPIIAQTVCSDGGEVQECVRYF